MSRRKTLVLSALILGTAAAVTALIFSTEPTASRSGAVRKAAMLVEVTGARRGAFRPTFVATGTVEPSRDIVLSPRVAGEVVRRGAGFTPGDYVRKGEVLLVIDPADYEIALERARSDLSQAEADLHLEMGRQSVARRDYALIDSSLALGNEDLILRKPQLETARARVEAARAAVKRAELDLERTTIRAPFDAHVLARNANVGSQVAPGDDLGRLVGLDSYWVTVTFPLSTLRWIRFPEGDDEAGSEVVVRNRTAWAAGETRRGRLYRLVGALEEETRLARALVEVPDPLNLRSGDSAAPRLMIGAFVEASVRGRELPETVRLDRDLVRADDTVWVMKDGRLEIRRVGILLRDARYAYVAEGLGDGDRVVTTNLSTVSEGLPLRVAGEGGAADTADAPVSPAAETAPDTAGAERARPENRP